VWTPKDLSKFEEHLAGAIDKVDAKLGAFENSETDKHFEPEVRVTRGERSLRVSINYDPSQLGSRIEP
jgi:hypothetical protein